MDEIEVDDENARETEDKAQHDKEEQIVGARISNEEKIVDSRIDEPKIKEEKMVDSIINEEKIGDNGNENKNCDKESDGGKNEGNIQTASPSADKEKNAGKEEEEKDGKKEEERSARSEKHFTYRSNDWWSSPTNAKRNNRNKRGRRRGGGGGDWNEYDYEYEYDEYAEEYEDDDHYGHNEYSPNYRYGAGVKGNKGKGKGDQSEVPPALIDIEGPWVDSEGCSIFVRRQVHTLPSPLVASFTPVNGKSRILSVRRELYFNEKDYGERWVCGNAELSVKACSRGRLLWIAEDRMSVWLRPDSIEEEYSDSFPWMIVENIPTKIRPEPSDDPCDQRLLEDGGRIACLLDIRQMLGAKSSEQEKLTLLLNDHDLFDGDPMVPSASSSEWDVLDTPKLDAIRSRVQDFFENEELENIITLGEDERIIMVGRHYVKSHPVDVANLRQRWTCSSVKEKHMMNRSIAHCLALYSVLENPLATNHRSNIHLALDPDLVRLYPKPFELFASPMNACVPNGHYASKWPHVDRLFGSAGRYPQIIDRLRTEVTLLVNPPWSDAYLEHLLQPEVLDRLRLDRRLVVTIPVRDAPWRTYVSESLAKNSIFLNRFYDPTSMQYRDAGQPVIYYDSSI